MTTASEIISSAQIDLNALGYEPALAVDGELGPKTHAAIDWFEAKYHSGVVMSWDDMVAALRAVRNTPARNTGGDKLTDNTQVSTSTAQSPPVPIPPAVAPVVAGNALLNGTLFTTLESLRLATDAEVTKLYAQLAPWYVQMFVKVTIITDAVDYAFATVQGAAKGVIASLPTAQQLVTEAIGFIDRHVPSSLKALFVGPIEDRIIVALQQHGVLPLDFTRAAAEAKS